MSKPKQPASKSKTPAPAMVTQAIEKDLAPTDGVELPATEAAVVDQAEADEADRDEITQAVPQGKGIRYKGETTVDHHLFKSTLGNMQKNQALDDAEPRYEPTPHIHWYHSVDSGGLAQEFTPSIGGHFHFVTLVTAGHEGEEPRVVFGPPMRWVRKKTGKKSFMRVAEALGAHDQHTHEATYQWSEKLKINVQVSKEFVRYLAEVDAKKPQRVEGIKG